MFEWLTAKTVAVVFAGILLGGMIAFTFLIVPMLRRVLKRELARNVLRRLFPAYYHYNTALAIAAGIAAALTEFRQEAVALAILGATFVFARTHLLRAIRTLQPADDSDHAPDVRFKIVHGLSLLLNLAQMIATAVLMVRLMPSLFELKFSTIRKNNSINLHFFPMLRQQGPGGLTTQLIHSFSS